MGRGGAARNGTSARWYRRPLVRAERLREWDETCLARDPFYWEQKRAAIVGGCELFFVEEPPEDGVRGCSSPPQD